MEGKERRGEEMQSAAVGEIRWMDGQGVPGLPGVGSTF